jgi:hypothetical protein
MYATANAELIEAGEWQRQLTEENTALEAELRTAAAEIIRLRKIIEDIDK